MNQARSFAQLTLPLALVLSACGGGSVATTGSQTVEQVNAQDVRGPFIQAGTPLTVSMDTPLDTLSGTAGQPFTATVTTPLTSARGGALLVPSGSKVHGVIASTGSTDNPRLRLDLQTIETARGAAPIQASVRHAARTDYAGPTQFVPAGDDPFLYPYDGAAWGWYGPVGGGPYAAAFNPTEIRIPRGASIQLVLTRPIVPPGSMAE